MRQRQLQKPAVAASRPWDPFSIIIARSLVSHRHPILLNTVACSHTIKEGAPTRRICFPSPSSQGPRKCSNAVCLNCIAKLNGQTFRCRCGKKPKIDSTLWMIGAYHSVISAFEFVTGARPASASEGYTAMPSRSQAPCSVPNPLLELGPATSTALPQYRTATSWGQGMRAATVETAAAAATPLPAPQSLPSLLLHRRRESQVGVAEVFKTYLPGEMPCSPMAR